MTQIGLCHNATFGDTRLTAERARELRPAWARTIVYADDRSREAVIASARELSVLETRTLVVFNTESAGCAVDEIETFCSRLGAFLNLADGAVHAIEPGNELDTPGWTDSRGRPISDELIIAIGKRAAEVCHSQGVLCLSPSLLTGPEEGRFERVAAGLSGHVDAMAVHPYYCSVGGAPWEGWRFGSLEAKAEVCLRLGNGLPTWFTECGCPTRFDGIGEQLQAAWTTALRRFSHPNIAVVLQFALTDAVGGAPEMEQGKDWGLIDEGGQPKAAFVAFAEVGGGEVPEVNGHWVGDGVAEIVERHGLEVRGREDYFGGSRSLTPGTPKSVLWDNDQGEGWLVPTEPA